MPDDFPNRPLAVLLVEDSEPDVALTVEAFEDAKIDVELVIAGDGAAAVELLDDAARGERRPPELILLDLGLPKVNGLQVLEYVKSHRELKVIPVVVMTSSQSPADLRGAYERHANSFISKPVDQDEFVETVHGIQDYWAALVRLPSRS